MAGAGERANYFYCVRITDPEIRKNISDALTWISDKDGQYDQFHYTEEMIHVTLCEVSLQSDEEIAKASKVLQEFRTQLKACTPTTPLTIRGIATFFDKVMYGKVECGDDFRTFAEYLKEKVKESGVEVVQKHAFTPHMTILKITGVKARRAKIENLNPWLYVNLKNTLFGQQNVRSIHLCKMGSGRREDGFYLTPGEVLL